MTEGFWWGFTACCLLKDFNLIEIDINHKKELMAKQMYINFKEFL